MEVLRIYYSVIILGDFMDEIHKERIRQSILNNWKNELDENEVLKTMQKYNPW